MALSEDRQKNSRNQWTPWLVLAVCVLPVVAATVLYLFWEPEKFVNNGELIEPIPISNLLLSTVDGNGFTFQSLAGAWAFVSLDRSSCDELCERKLYLMRQIRLTQGAEKDRLKRIHFSIDSIAISDAIREEYAGTEFVTLANITSLEIFGKPEQAIGYIFVVDQIGNLMMKFPSDINPSLMKKDIANLLKISKAWKTIHD